MTDIGPRFCPRCGTARVSGMAFCPNCGLKVAELNGESTSGGRPEAVPVDAAGEISNKPRAPTTVSLLDDAADDQPQERVPSTSHRFHRDRAPRIPAIAIAAVIVLAGFIAFGLLTRPQPNGAPEPGGQPGAGAQPRPGVTAEAGATAGISAPIVGLTILSPTDGQAVATKDVVVIGIAPPGLTITQDIGFNLDQHTTVDGTGHWAIKLGLNEGDNKLTFRIGDDHSTQQTIRVIYTPPPTH